MKSEFKYIDRILSENPKYKVEISAYQGERRAVIECTIGREWTPILGEAHNNLTGALEKLDKSIKDQVHTVNISANNKYKSDKPPENNIDMLILNDLYIHVYPSQDKSVNMKANIGFTVQDRVALFDLNFNNFSEGYNTINNIVGLEYAVPKILKGLEHMKIEGKPYQWRKEFDNLKTIRADFTVYDTIKEKLKPNQKILDAFLTQLAIDSLYETHPIKKLNPFA